MGDGGRRGRAWRPPRRPSGPSETRSAPAKVGEFLEQFLEREGVKQQMDRVSVLDEWAERVGPKIAEVTRARSVAEGTLFVEVRSSAWLMELNMMKGRILTRLNEGRPQAPLEKLVFVLSQDG